MRRVFIFRRAIGGSLESKDSFSLNKIQSLESGDLPSQSSDFRTYLHLIISYFRTQPYYLPE